MEKIRKQLMDAAEPDYGKFASKLLPGTENILGVRLPVLRKIAKKIAKEEGTGYLEYAGSFYFEEIMLQGFVIGYLKEDISVILKQIQEFIPKIDNWSVCDSFCSSLKIVKEYKEEMWNFLRPYFQSEKEYEIRFAVVMLIFYFIEEKYIKEVLMIIDGIKHEGYYVKMAAAWAISICYVEFGELTERYLKDNNLDNFTFHKALQKIVESKQIKEVEKEKIRRMKRG